MGGITPHNTVVDSSSPLLIKHHPDEQHQITWSISHLDYEDPLFSGDLRIYDLFGFEVLTVPLDYLSLGNCSYLWDGKLPGPPESFDAPKGIYTSKVEIYCPFPMGCEDTDKVPAISNVSVGQFAWDEDGFPDRASVTLVYTCTQALQPCQLQLVKPDLTDGVVLDGTDVLDGTVGQHSVNVHFEVDRQVLGNYHFVITGTQADGSGNRNGSPKPAIPRGAVCTIWPPAVGVLGAGVSNSHFSDALTLMGATDSATQTHYAAYEGWPTVLATRDAMRQAAVVYIDGHANQFEIAISEHGTGDGLLSGQIAPPGQTFVDRPERDLYYISNFPFDLDHVLFVFYNGCNSWCTPADGGVPQDLVSSTLAKGANNCAGFQATVGMPQAGFFGWKFFHYAMVDGLSVRNANLAALADVLQQFLMVPCGVETFTAANYDQLLKPARWGQ
jgi:hypothetical protein